MLLFIFLCVYAYACVKSDTVHVLTSKGDVIGQRQDGYDTFFGIPFAKVDENNPFGNSLEHPNFEKPFIANDSSIICPQVIRKVGGILQCLRLNIYVPHTTNITNKLPILVWFYGGGFVLGSAGEYGGQHLLKHNIIVVTVNYRLGPYGFLCLNDASVPGNQGFKDQISALRWIKQNIGAFGGDSNKVTISGESYGGGAVDLHLYSLYDKLFDKVIIESGSIFADGFFVRPDYEAATKIAKYLGHNTDNTKEALKVLAKENPLNIMGAIKNLNIRLTACREKTFPGVLNFINTDLYHLSNPKKIKDTKILIGYNSKEDFGSYANKPDEFYQNLGDIFYDYLKRSFVLKEDELKILSDILKKFYLGGKEIGSESMLDLSDFSSDFRLNYAAEWSIDKFIAQGALVYKYLFSYVGGSPYQNITGVGAIHTEELKYLFEMNSPLTNEEQKMMRLRMTTMWAQFVKFGNPTPDKTELLPVIWLPVEGSSRPYFNIDVDMTMEDSVYHERINFWRLWWHNYVTKSILYDSK